MITPDYIAGHLVTGNYELEENYEFGSFTAYLNDEYSTRLVKIDKNDDETYVLWHSLLDHVDKNTHFEEWRIPGGITLAVMASAPITDDKTSLTKLIMNDVKTHGDDSAPNYRCPKCGRLAGEESNLGTIKINSKGKTGAAHLRCGRCGARYKQ